MIKGKLKKGWEDNDGREFYILGDSIRVNVMDWTPIVYDGEEDPSWLKTSAIDFPEPILQEQPGKRRIENDKK